RHGHPLRHAPLLLLSRWGTSQTLTSPSACVQGAALVRRCQCGLPATERLHVTVPRALVGDVALGPRLLPARPVDDPGVDDLLLRRAGVPRRVETHAVRADVDV